MKYLRLLAVSLVVIVFIVPIHVMVTISADEDQYRKFKQDTQDRILEKLWGWAYGRQNQENVIHPARIFTA